MQPASEGLAIQIRSTFKFAAERASPLRVFILLLLHAGRLIKRPNPQCLISLQVSFGHLTASPAEDTTKRRGSFDRNFLQPESVKAILLAGHQRLKSCGAADRFQNAVRLETRQAQAESPRYV